MYDEARQLAEEVFASKREVFTAKEANTTLGILMHSDDF